MFIKNAIKATNKQQGCRCISYQRLKNWYGSLVKPAPHEPPYKHVVQIGDPVLRTVADPIPIKLIKSPETNFLVARMKHVFKKYECMGLSAPQIGVPLRVIAFEFNEKHMTEFSLEEQKSREMSLVPFTVIINPSLKVRDYNKVVFAEGCLSVRGYVGDVPRYRTVEINGFDSNGELVALHARGWLARIAQHEMDHLNGKLYVDTMDAKTFACSCWQVVNERNGKVSLPFGHE